MSALAARAIGAVGAAADAVEARLARAVAFVERPRAFHALVVGLVVLGLLVRLPLAFRANDVSMAHGDSWVFFNQAWVDILGGNAYPDPHRGSGPQLLLAAVLWLLDVPPGDAWLTYGQPVPEAAARAALVAHALSATLSAGVVAATYLLARHVLPPIATLGAMALVALDPFLLMISTSVMSEPLYIPLFVLAIVTVFHARRHPAWLVATGALMGLGHVMRVNGLVMVVMTIAFAWILLRDAPRRRLVGWSAAAVAAFLLVASPYLAWRAEHLPHAFDYGTNQRFWADELWDLDDAWWSEFTFKEGAPRETMSDYFARHDWRDAAERLWHSIQWQVFDFLGVGQWPPLEEPGGRWAGGNPSGAALTPLLAGLLIVAAFVALPRRRELWFLPLAFLFTFATFVWIYPLVRSVRYYSPLIPLVAIVALVGWQHLAMHVRRPRLVATGVFGAYLLLYGALPLLHVAGGVADTLRSPDVRLIAGVVGSLWVLLALSPLAPAAWARLRGRADGGRSDAERADT